jgi:hypothetical protein
MSRDRYESRLSQIQFSQEYTRKSDKYHGSWTTFSLLIPYNLQKCNMSSRPWDAIVITLHHLSAGWHLPGCDS